MKSRLLVYVVFLAVAAATTAFASPTTTYATEDGSIRLVIHAGATTVVPAELWVNSEHYTGAYYKNSRVFKGRGGLHRDSTDPIDVPWDAAMKAFAVRVKLHTGTHTYALYLNGKRPLASTPTPLATTPPSDLTGEWEIVCCDGHYTGKVRLQQNGAELTGTFYNQNNGSSGEVVGKVNGSSVTFKRTWSTGSQQYTLTLTNGGRTLTGSLSGSRDTSVGTDVTMTR